MNETTLKERILKHDGRVPRYTSYPTAPQFQPVDGSQSYEDWLAMLDEEATISLYLHVPFCPKMCHYCGCHTKVTRRYGPVEDYMYLLMREAALLSDHLKPGQRVTEIHFGGGSPTMLRADDFTRLMEALREHLDIAGDAEIAIEIDPRQLTESRVKAYAKSGVTRASLGTQDFDQKVMSAVNREQPFELSYNAVNMLREHGIQNINLDLMYGLPHQNADTARRAADYAALLKPDRIALFGYAHVPWMKKHMRLIDESALPDGPERYDLFEIGARVLQDHGYIPVGIDHFVKPDDSMAKALEQGTLHRNFQGYTTDNCAALLGLGVSAIGKVPQGFIQNSPDMPVYKEHILDGKLPTAKICAIDAEDRLRAALIEKLMCYLYANLYDTCKAHGFPPQHLNNALPHLTPYIVDGLVSFDERSGALSILPDARHAARLVCACFDSYYQQSVEKRHAVAV